MLLVLVAGCAEDRPRPSPLEPGPAPGLTLTVREPAVNSFVLSGRSVRVVVSARDEARRVRETGFVAWRQGGEQVDSVMIRYPLARTAAVDTFQLAIPATYATNTQVDIYGLARTGDDAVHRTEPVTIVVIRCGPGVPGCD